MSSPKRPISLFMLTAFALTAFDHAAASRVSGIDGSTCLGWSEPSGQRTCRDRGIVPEKRSHEETCNLLNASANGAQPGEAENDIQIHDGRVSLHVSGRSLLSVLDQLSVLQTDVRIVVGDTRIDRPVTATFQGLPLDAALRRLAGEDDLMLLYGTGGETKSVLKVAVICPKGQGESMMRWDAGQDGEVERLAIGLDSSDEAERGRAVHELVERLGMESLHQVIRALDDPSDKVRELALSSALEGALTLPVDTLIRLATADAVPSVRVSAMEALGSNLEGTDAEQRLRAIAEVAASDPEPLVRETAARVLEQLTNQRTSPDQ